MSGRNSAKTTDPTIEGEDDDHDRLEDGSQRGDGVVHLVVIDVGDLEEHLGELAGFLADVHHGDDHVGEDTGGLERGDDGFAFLDGLVNLFDGLGNDHVAGGVAGDVEGLQDGDAGGDERAERAGEARDGALALDVAEHGHLELHRIDGRAAALGAAPGVEADDGEHEDDQQPNDIGNGGGHGGLGFDEESGGSENDLRDHRQVLIGVGEHFLELRNDENHQEDQDGDGDEHDDHRIDHGGDDLVFELLGLFLILGETVEHDFEHTAEFAGLDHVHIELVENARVLGQGLGEGGAALDVLGECRNGGAQHGMRLLFLKHGEAAQEGQAGIDERGELARENHQALRFHAAAEVFLGCLGLGGGVALGGRHGLGTFLGLALFHDLGGVETLGAELLDRLLFRVGGDGASGLFAFGVEGGVGEVGHGFGLG